MTGLAMAEAQAPNAAGPEAPAQNFSIAVEDSRLTRRKGKLRVIERDGSFAIIR